DTPVVAVGSPDVSSRTAKIAPKTTDTRRAAEVELWQTLMTRHITGDLLRRHRQLCLPDIRAVLQGKLDLFGDGDIGDGHKRWRIRRLQTHTPRPHALRNVERFLQDILSFMH